jgi:hypothetical protein
MPALLQVMALAAMAFLASALLGREQRRTGALSFYLLAGVLIGPLGIGLLDDQSQRLLQPFLSLSVTWLGWLRGMKLFDPRAPRPTWRVSLAALVEGGAIILAVMAMLHALAPTPAFGASVPLASGAAIGLAVAGSSYFAAELLRERLGEAWAPFRFLEAVSNVDALVPVLGLLALCLVLPAPHLALPLTSFRWAPAAGVLALGLTLGMVFLLAAGRRAPLERAWLVLLGAAFLAAGVASQLGLPELAVGFVAGAVTAQSVGGRRISDVAASSERPVALLIAVIVGIRLAPDLVLFGLALVAVGMRTACPVLTLPLLKLLGPREGIKGLALLGLGGYPLAVAAQIDLTYGGWLGSLALTAGAAACLASEVLGTAKLYAVLREQRAQPATEQASG